MITAEKRMCEQATGCSGAGDYRGWALLQGYKHCEVVDWGSSAGDWSFIVSKDGETWQMMWQTNNYPRPGFTRDIATGDQWTFHGTKEDAFAQIAQLQ